MNARRVLNALRWRAYNLPGAVTRKVSRVSPRLAAVLILPQFFREAQTVVTGQLRYGEAERLGLPLHELRRRTHMIEKGLVMRPRRVTFAADYIEWTVKAANRAANLRLDCLSGSEWEWIHSTLGQYFAATADSDDVRIRRARAEYVAPMAQQLARGPQPKNTGRPPVDFESFRALAVRRTSVRWFLDEKVPRELIDQAVEVAAESPTACNRQPYRIEIIDDPQRLAKAVEIPMGTAGFGHNIPCLAVVIGDLAAFSHERDRHLIYIDAALASMSFVLALETQGLASCCINWPEIPDKERAISALLAIPSHERVIMLIAIGYADPDGMSPFSQKRQVGDARRYGAGQQA